MAFTDEEKLGVVRAAIIERLNAFTDWTVFKTFLQGLTRDQIKTFIINKLQEAQTEKTTLTAVLAQEETCLAELESEISSDV